MLVLGSELACPNLFSRTSVTATALTFGQALDSTVAGGFISYERQSKFPQQSYSGRSWILPTWRPHQELYIKQQPNRKKHMKPSDHYTSSRPVRWEMPRVPRSLWSCACPGQICLGDPWQRLTGLSALRGYTGSMDRRCSWKMSRYQRIWYWYDEISRMDPSC